MNFSAGLTKLANYEHGVLLNTETKSTYIMIESTLSFDDIGAVPGLLWLYLFGSKVTYAATKMELESAWGQG